MTREEIIEKAAGFGRWYHSLELAPGYKTNGMPFEDVWSQIESVAGGINYSGKTVLDLGTMDGRWAFEAEKRGARLVAAGDVWLNPRLQFAREVLGSSIVTLPNLDIHCLADGVKLPMRFWEIGSFDIIHCTGVLYHVQNPLLALHQVRRCLSNDGLLLLETGCWLGGGSEPVARLNRSPMVYDDISTYWLMNYSGLVGCLELCGFRLEENTLRRFQQHGTTERICAICKPVEISASIDNYGQR